ncbi:putative nuclease HARBI1 [Procambarus clarkii]|uniref:putative nuclease HARBI1 n=1 Tax=Procambarus clarkii TaxID=6728 RepID=UPI001E66FF40|nr:putative nuclease HARBI1 [Procambarus clarkii]XP_045584852.1 putative nuclease HARBI1 [Procambarus clarkii]XP_045584853.1 putative nuclease HARBI1 [Procambarus clarkii]
MELLAALAHDRALRKERVFKDPLDPLDISDEHLLKYYCFPRHVILRFCDVLKNDIARITKRSRAIPCHTIVLVALRFYTSGSLQSVIADSTGLSQSSVSRIITEVTDAFYRKAVAEIKMPTEMSEIIETKAKFDSLNGFPNVIGAIDCTHVPIRAPKEREYMFVNQHNYHSLNIQVVSNSEHLILDFCARYPGSAHDSLIWANSRLRSRFEAGEFGSSYLLGDSGYPQEPYIMTPFKFPGNPPEVFYNRSHSKTRVVIEQTFVLLKSRFRCLHSSGGCLKHEPEKCSKIAIACILLHNYCIQERIPIEDLIGNDDLPQSEHKIHNASASGQAVRREVVEKHFS